MLFLCLRFNESGGSRKKNCVDAGGERRDESGRTEERERREYSQNSLKLKGQMFPAMVGALTVLKKCEPWGG